MRYVSNFNPLLNGYPLLLSNKFIFATADMQYEKLSNRKLLCNLDNTFNNMLKQQQNILLFKIFVIDDIVNSERKQALSYIADEGKMVQFSE